ncbi:hypothetical protein AUJ46_06525 [Candidatus Peregrinibacteria bacterium CG1_02_54_53]|nr:MAG: hypothetical protein AUJ46_06525 [Candidatus Peregrinibacteria bacterium CG1_02_54_53]
MTLHEIQEYVRPLVTNSMQQIFGDTSINLSQALLAIAVLVVGWIIAVLVYAICVRVMRFFAIDKLIAKTPLHDLLRMLGMHRNPVEILALLLAAFIGVYTLKLSSDVIGLIWLSTFFSTIAGYLPNLVTAFIILIIGGLGARFLHATTVQVIQRVGTGHENTLGNIVHWIIFVLVSLFALGQLGLDLSFLATNLSIMVAVLIGLMGLGCIIGARPFLENFFLCRQLKGTFGIGTTVEIDEKRGVVREFTATSVVLEHDGKRTVLSASHFFRHSYVICS